MVNLMMMKMFGEFFSFFFRNFCLFSTEKLRRCSWKVIGVRRNCIGSVQRSLIELI